MKIERSKQYVFKVCNNGIKAFMIWLIKYTSGFLAYCTCNSLFTAIRDWYKEEYMYTINIVLLSEKVNDIRSNDNQIMHQFISLMC